jgi:hypothetical protein
MTEELTLEKAFRDSGTVDGNKRGFASHTVFMHRVRRQLLPCPAFAQEEHRRFRGRNPAQSFDDGRHGLAGPDETAEAVLLPQPGSKLAILGFQS